MHDFEPFVLPALQNSEILPVLRNISASLQIAPSGFSPEISSPPATLFQAKISRGGEKIMSPP